MKIFIISQNSTSLTVIFTEYCQFQYFFLFFQTYCCPQKSEEDLTNRIIDKYIIHKIHKILMAVEQVEIIAVLVYSCGKYFLKTLFGSC